MAEHTPFTWFHYIPFIGDLQHHVSMGAFGLDPSLRAGLHGISEGGLRAEKEALTPSDRLTIRNFFEIFTEMIMKFLR